MASIGDTSQVYKYLPMMVTKLHIVLALFTFYDWFPMLTAELRDCMYYCQLSHCVYPAEYMVP